MTSPAPATPASTGSTASEFWRAIGRGFSHAASRGLPILVILGMTTAVVGSVWLLRAPAQAPGAPIVVLLGADEPGVSRRPVPATLFEHDSAQLRPDGPAQLEEIATELEAEDARVVMVVGLADRTGNDARNKPLSQQRAETVAAVLAEKVASAEVAPIGLGVRFSTTGAQCDGLSEQAEKDCLAPDRRVEIWSSSGADRASAPSATTPRVPAATASAPARP